jgi:protein dithiol:quinone oxidoreductase
MSSSQNKLTKRVDFSMKLKLTFRSLMWLGAAACLVFLGAAYLLEYGFHQAPCSLCLLQRYTLWIVCLIFVFAGIHAPKNLGRYLYSVIATIFSIIGILLASRQIWIQSLPGDQLPNCTAGLERLFAYQPGLEVIKTILMGGGECADSDFKILGLTLAEQSGLMFAGFIVYLILIIFWQKKRRI